MKNKQFHIEQLDQNRLIKENNLKEVINPALFDATGGTTVDGLLSNEIFGITKDERSGIPAFINLGEYFIQPYFYKVWLKIDRNLRGCVYETQNFKINKEGYLEPDDNGETGIKFLMKNIDKIKFKETKRDQFLNVLNKAKKDNILFTNKFIITPPFYRDVNTQEGKMGVGEINKLYISLLNSVRSLKESSGYGLDMVGGTRGRIQDNMLEIHNWYTIGETESGGEHTGTGIFKKMGTMRRSVMSKTVDYSVRLVLTAQELNYNHRDDMMVTLDYSAVPVSACIACMYPFVIYELRQFFINEFGGKSAYSYIDKNGNAKEVELKDVLLEFSDDRFDKEISNFIHSYSNRLKPLMVPNKQNLPIKMRFKGYHITREQYAAGVREGTPVERDLTWLDLFYRISVRLSKDKTAVISRYPIDSYFNQLYTKFNVTATTKTEPMVIGDEFYPWYPSFKQEDIGRNTSNTFIDSLNICNVHCGLMGADFDGDMCTVKIPWTVEANKEIDNYIQSNSQYITFSGINGRVPEKEPIQAMYNLTLVLPETKLTNPQF